MTTHRRVADVWRPPGMGACYRVACSCGWISRTPGVGYGYPISHDEDYARHRKESAAYGHDCEHTSLQHGADGCSVPGCLCAFMSWDGA